MNKLRKKIILPTAENGQALFAKSLVMRNLKEFLQNKTVTLPLSIYWGKLGYSLYGQLNENRLYKSLNSHMKVL